MESETIQLLKKFAQHLTLTENPLSNAEEHMKEDPEIDAVILFVRKVLEAEGIRYRKYHVGPLEV